MLFSLSFPVISDENAENAESFEANIYLRFLKDGTIIYRDTKPEMGQGISTGLAMVVCDELGADWQKFVVERPPLTSTMEIHHSLESSAGSNGMLAAYLPLRQAAAGLRQRFVESASEKWGCSGEDCLVSDGLVRRRSTDEVLEFRELFAAVVQKPVPEDAPLKQEADLRLVGTPVSILENQAISTGNQRYAIDIELEGMVYASIERSPTTDGQLVSFDDTACRRIDGVLGTIELPSFPYQTDAANKWQEKYRGTKSGVAVIAKSTWHAMKGRRVLKTEWSKSRYRDHDDNLIKEEMLAVADERIRNVASYGSVQDEVSRAPEERVFHSRYYNPYQENAQMEPLNAVASYDGETLTLWAGSQSPTLAIAYVSEITGVPVENIVIHSMRSGGGFGRRYFYDFIAEAGYLAMQLKRPVKVTWSREDCIKHGRYHLARFDEHTLVLDSNDYPVAWDSLTRSGSNYGWLGRNIMLDYYAGFTPHRATRHAEGDSLVLFPGSWRSVDAHPVALARECFIDEVAAQLNEDPVALRLRWLSKAAVAHDEPGLDTDSLKRRRERQQGLASILSLAKQTERWDQPSRDGTGKGVSLSYFYGTYVCQVAYVSRRHNDLSIDKISCYFDCGKVVNPQLVKAQIEGSIIWAFSAVVNPAIQVEKGVVVQSNFDNYPVVRGDMIPEIEIHLVASDRAPNRVGEAAVPDTAPAILNAIFNLTGQRIRELPISLENGADES